MEIKEAENKPTSQEVKEIIAWLIRGSLIIMWDFKFWVVGISVLKYIS